MRNVETLLVLIVGMIVLCLKYIYIYTLELMAINMWVYCISLLCEKR